MADWVMHSYTRIDEESQEHKALKKKFFSYFKEMDAEDKIEFSPDENDYFEKDQYEDYANEKFIQPYENQLFWDELIHRLGERDVINTIGIEQYKKMDMIERVRKVEEIKEHYSDEFEKNGLNNLKVRFT